VPNVKQPDLAQFLRDSSFTGKQSSDASGKHLPLCRKTDGIILLIKKEQLWPFVGKSPGNVPKIAHSAEMTNRLSLFRVWNPHCYGRL
jgi:hypothetical protein